jgi:outer membrane cobalamin receptor
MTPGAHEQKASPEFMVATRRTRIRSLPMLWRVALTGALVLSMAPPVWAASCCGGGSATSLILPKFSKAMVDVSVDFEHYDGFWNEQGDHVPDPPGSDLKQYRLNLGYAHRLASRWQTSVSVPYVWNENQYAGLESSTNGLGDTTVNLWYEAFDGIQCVWKVRSAKDLRPAAYFGASLIIPTGVSPYDDVKSSFDITGRGLYRLDGNMLLEKTIYPWNAALQLGYGRYLERSVNREYGNYVEPYDKTLGDRRQGTISGGYTHFLDSMDSLTFTAAYSDLSEADGEINGRTDPTTGFRKRSVAGILAFATMDRNWVYKLVWSHALQGDDWGRNFPTTDIMTMGMSYVFR